MQSLVVLTDSKGNQRLGPARTSETKPSGDSSHHEGHQKRIKKHTSINTRQVVTFAEAPVPEIPMSVSGFQYELVISSFYSQYKWAGLWKPFFDSLYDHNFDTAGRTGIQALLYGHMGMDHGLVDIQVRGRQFYGQCISQVQSQLDQCDHFKKGEVARIAMPVMLMAMYSVSPEGKHLSSAPPPCLGITTQLTR